MISKVNLSYNTEFTIELQLCQHMKQSVLEGRLKPGDRLPTFKQMADTFEVGVSTVRAAFERLSRQGIITKRPRRGIFITDDAIQKCSGSNELNERDASIQGGELRGVTLAIVFPETTLVRHPYSNNVELLCRNFEECVLGHGGSCEFVPYNFISRDISDFDRLLKRLENVSAIFCATYGFEENQLVRLASLGKPCVLYDTRPLHFISTVCENSTGILHRMLAHLEKNGFSDIAFAYYSQKGNFLHWGQARRDGFLSWKDSRGETDAWRDVYEIVVPEDEHPVDIIEQGKIVAERILDSGKRYDAVIAVNDLMAKGVLDVLKDRNIAVPDEMAVCGFDNTLLSKSLDLTTVNLPMREFAHDAVTILSRLLQGEDKSKISRIFDMPELIIRGSSTNRLFGKRTV